MLDGSFLSEIHDVHDDLLGEVGVLGAFFYHYAERFHCGVVEAVVLVEHLFAVLLEVEHEGTDVEEGVFRELPFEGLENYFSPVFSAFFLASARRAKTNAFCPCRSGRKTS